MKAECCTYDEVEVEQSKGLEYLVAHSEAFLGWERNGEAADS